MHREIAILPSNARPVRVGFVSDLHIGPTTPRRLLETAFAELARSSLDVLLLGGDYVFLDATEAKAELLSSLVRGVPAARKFAVFGNHDLWTGHELLERALARADVELLTNANTRVGPIAVVGLDDPWTGDLDAARAFRGAAEAEAVVVLCHSPDGLPEALRAVRDLPRRPRGLFACGHTHGGHIAAPWGPLVMPSRMGKEYPHGSHHVPPLLVHVSRGVGGIELPIRTYAPPDVVVFELTSSRSSDE